MIDTIVVRLHDLKKYAEVIKELKLNRNKGFTLKTATVDAKEYSRIEKMKHIDTKFRFDVMELNRTGEYLVKTQVAKQVSNSGHYAFAYRIDVTRDFIEFNFSVPKYKFGSNVLMFVEHYGDRDFIFYDCRTLEYNIRRAPAFIKSFIKYFLKKEFITKIDLIDIEVNRIDVCFNQVFKSKEEALAYFNLQKKLRKKHSREEDGGKTDYNTSFMYSTKRSSSKIYHKGTEYRKNDLKEHSKINKEKGYIYFDIDKYQELADRILRYELTIRCAELNYLFKHNIFRSECPFYKIDYANYMRIGNTIKRNERIAKRIGELPQNQKEEFRMLHPYEKISKEDRMTYKYVSRLIERKPLFMMEISKAEEDYNKKTVNYECDRANFSLSLISLCLRKLVVFISEFKIKELPNEEKVSILIDEYNSRHRTKLQKSDMVQFYQQLSKYGSFKEAGIAVGYSRATWYRYKDRFKKIGITENHVQPNSDFSIPKAPLDLQLYHDIVSFGHFHTR